MTTQTINDLLYDWGKDFHLFIIEALGVVENKELRKPGITRQQLVAVKELSKLVNAKIKKFLNPDLCTQEELNYAKKMGVSIMAGKGLGKSTIEAWAIIWFMLCFPNCKNMCTAPTQHHLKDVLWAEVRKWIKIGDDVTNGFISSQIEWNSTQIKHNNPKSNSMSMARTCAVNGSADEQADTLAGKHEEYMLFVADEASALPDPVFRPLETTLTSMCNVILMSFNPTRATGYALDTHTKHKEYWITLHWSAEECEELITQDHLDRLKKKYGVGSNMYRINVKGLPPKADEDVLIPLEWVLNAVDREDVYHNESMPIKMAADIGAGSDLTVCMVRQGYKILSLDSFDNVDTMRVAEWLAGKISQARPKVFFLDMVGVGQGVHDRLKEFDLGCQVVGIKGSNSPRDGERFDYLIDELWWKMRELFEKGLISIPNNDELITELTNRRYKTQTNGKIKLETKLEMKRRGIRSPNFSDSLALSLYFPEDIHEGDQKKDSYDKAKERMKARIDGDLGWMAN